MSELPPAGPAMRPDAKTLARNGGLGRNGKTKMRQNLLWAGVTGVALLAGGGLLFSILATPTSKVGVAPEDQKKMDATAAAASTKTMSTSAQINDLQVREQQLQTQINSLNSEKAEADQEKDSLKTQLEAQQKDALRTIDALNKELDRRTATAAASPPPAAAAPVVPAPLPTPPGRGAGRRSQSAQNGARDPFAPIGADEGGDAEASEGGQRQHRSLGVVRAGDGPHGGSKILVGSAGPNAGTEAKSGASGSVAPGGYFSSSMQVYDTSRFVPPNAYATAKVLVGVDATTGVTQQADPKPVMLRILGAATHVGSDGKFQTTDLKGCLVNGAAYGELSSEKVYIKLQRITCPAGPGKFSVATVEGYVTYKGKAGVRGAVISREGGLTGRALVAGLFQGLGRSVSQSVQGSMQTFGVNSLGQVGTTQSLSPKQIAEGTVGGGVENASSMLAQYYIKRAEQYQPVIEMPTGIEVEIVFLSGFEVSAAAKK